MTAPMQRGLALSHVTLIGALLVACGGHVSDTPEGSDSETGGRGSSDGQDPAPGGSPSEGGASSTGGSAMNGGASSGGSLSGSCVPAYCASNGIGTGCCVTPNGPCGVDVGMGCEPATIAGERSCSCDGSTSIISLEIDGAPPIDLAEVHSDRPGCGISDRAGSCAIRGPVAIAFGNQTFVYEISACGGAEPMCLLLRFTDGEPSWGVVELPSGGRFEMIDVEARWDRSEVLPGTSLTGEFRFRLAESGPEGLGKVSVCVVQDAGCLL